MISVRTLKLLPLLLCALTASAAGAQSTGSAPFGFEMGQAPPLQISAQVQGTKANAPPGQCGCFWMQGGGLQIHRAFAPSLGAVIDLSYAHNGAINGTDEQLSVLNYLLGPRYTYRTSSRYTPYGQILAGASHVGSNYFVYQSNNTYLAVQAGAGAEVFLNRRFAVPVEADWVHSQALNGVNKRQNNLRVGIGIIYRVGAH